MNITKYIPSAVLILATCMTAQAAPIFSDDFNSYTAVTDTAFTDNYQMGGTGTFAIESAAGLDSTNSLSIPDTSDRHLTYKVGLTLDASTPLMLTWFFERPAGATSNVAVPEIGFADTSGANVDGGVALRLNGSSPQWQLRRTGSTAESGDSLGLAAGWYQMNVTMSFDSGLDTVLLSGTLFNADSNGNVGSSVSSFDPVAVANPFSDSTIFAGIRVQNNGVSNMDNFAITSIPEPSTFVMLFGSLAILCVMGRRRA